ncbi:MAG: hypothetical protein OXH31_05915 [Gammaproteobacteria bacterium]|nr:hypothetical protein [Gammaproteobacteria bacterium]
MFVARNTLQGTGVSVRDHGKAYGSEERLKGTAFLANANHVVWGTFLHEFMHLWVSDVEVIPSNFTAYWGYCSVGGWLGGFQSDELQSLGDGKYSAGQFEPHGAPNFVFYSELEMYLAGWLPASNVPDTWVAEDGEWSKKELTEEELADCEIKDSPLAGTLDIDCITEKDDNGNRVFTASKISSWSIEQVIEKIGPRVPNFEQSQKEFRVAFVLFPMVGDSFTIKELVVADLFIEEFSKDSFSPDQLRISIDDSPSTTYTLRSTKGDKALNYWEATRGRAKMEAGYLQSFRKPAR